MGRRTATSLANADTCIVAIDSLIALGGPDGMAFIILEVACTIKCHR
jgi:hypothetical protein